MEDLIGLCLLSISLDKRSIRDTDLRNLMIEGGNEPSSILSTWKFFFFNKLIKEFIISISAIIEYTQFPR